MKVLKITAVVENEPGALCQLLTSIAECGINLREIESRAIRGHPGQSHFRLLLEIPLLPKP